MNQEIGSCRAYLQRDGYVIVRQALAPRRIAELADACDHALSKMRGESSISGHLTTHIASFMIAEYYRDRPGALEDLVAFTTSSEVLSLMRDLGRPEEGTLTLRDVQYFHEPSTREYDGDWHRDGDRTRIEEMPPSLPSTLLRYRVAFAPDDHLEYIPGSHARPDTERELQLRKGAARNRTLEVGAKRIALAAGDVLVFDAWGIHRARYRTTAVRRSLDLLFGFGPPPHIDYSQLRKYTRAAARAKRMA